jgi:hypothetical protein
VVVFSGAGYSFDRSPELRARLLAAIDHVAAPVFFIHAENDYSLSSGKALDAHREYIGKPHRLKIYPPIGRTVDDGHDFLYLGVSIWEPDVFAKTCGSEPAGTGLTAGARPTTSVEC